MKVVIILTIFVALWFGFLRPWLRPKPWMAWFFASAPVEWIELNVYRKSESLGWNRYLAGLGTLVTTIANTDPGTAQMLVQMFAPVLPESMQGLATFVPMIITLFGLFGEWQRRDTSKPIEAVAVASDAPIAVHDAVAQVEAANENLKQVVKDAA